MSTTVVTYPIVTALVEAERILGPERQWKPVNETQGRFLNEFFAVCRKERVPEIESLASWNAAEICAFLARHGFAIRLEPFGEGQFGAASVLDLPVEWIEKGHVTSIHTPKSHAEEPQQAGGWPGRLKVVLSSRIESPPLPTEEYPAVLIASEHVRLFRAPHHEHPVACLKTKSKDKVYMTVLPQPPAEFDLVAKAQELASALKPTNEFGGLIFPMVSLDQHVNVEWLEGMETTEIQGRPAGIAKALQQTRLRMNEIGARAESAVVLTVSVAALQYKPPHIIDRPFLIWFEREGLSKPLFVGHITEENWKNPGDISR